MALGEKLRNARLDARLTTAQVATATRMKLQIVEDIEREDFRRMAAPIYAKGFIRLYAAKVGLDPAPLVEEYVARYVNPVPADTSQRKTPVLQAPKKVEPVPVEPKVAPEVKEQDLFVEPPKPPAAPVVPEVEEGPPRQKVDWAKIGGNVKEFCSGTVVYWRKRAREVQDHFRSLRDPWRKRELSLPMIRFVESPAKWFSVAVGVLIIFILLMSTITRVFHRPSKGNVPPPAQETREHLRLAAEPPAPYFD